MSFRKKPIIFTHIIILLEKKIRLNSTTYTGSAIRVNLFLRRNVNRAFFFSLLTGHDSFAALSSDKNNATADLRSNTSRGPFCVISDSEAVRVTNRLGVAETEKKNASTNFYANYPEVLERPKHNGENLNVERTYS